MPAEFLTESQARRYGRFQADPSPEQLERYFALGPGDLTSIGRRRGDWTRLGFAVQLGTVRFLGTFVTRLEETPPSVIQHMAATLGVSPAEWTTYVSSRARLVHIAEISRLYGSVSFGDPPLSGRFLRWLYERAWTGDDRPTVLLDLSTAWLVDHKVLLPGITRLTKLVARVRERANRRAWRQSSRSVSADQRLVLERLLEIDPGTGTSGLDRLRRPPSSPTVDGLVAALDRLEEVQALGGDDIDLGGAPAGRVRALAREAFPVKAQRVARRTPERRLATLAAFACRLHRDAHDDVIDVFLSVAATMTARAERAGRTQRLASLADLDAAALVLRQAAMVVLDAQVPDPTVRSSVFEKVSAAQLQAAVDLIGRTSGAGDVSLVGLLSRYPTVQRFLPRLLELVHFDATHVNDIVLAALRHLRLVNRGEAAMAEAPTGIVSDTWRQLAVPHGAIDKRGYTLCLVDKLRAALRRRDVFVPAGDRWGDPRRLLLEPAAWKRAAPGVLAALALPSSSRTATWRALPGSWTPAIARPPAPLPPTPPSGSTPPTQSATGSGWPGSRPVWSLPRRRCCGPTSTPCYTRSTCPRSCSRSTVGVVSPTPSPTPVAVAAASPISTSPPAPCCWPRPATSATGRSPVPMSRPSRRPVWPGWPPTTSAPRRSWRPTPASSTSRPNSASPGSGAAARWHPPMASVSRSPSAPSTPVRTPGISGRAGASLCTTSLPTPTPASLIWSFRVLCGIPSSFWTG